MHRETRVTHSPTIITCVVQKKNTCSHPWQTRSSCIYVHMVVYSSPSIYSAVQSTITVLYPRYFSTPQPSQRRRNIEDCDDGGTIPPRTYWKYSQYRWCTNCTWQTPKDHASWTWKVSHSIFWQQTLAGYNTSSTPFTRVTKTSLWFPSSKQTVYTQKYTVLHRVAMVYT